MRVSKYLTRMDEVFYCEKPRENLKVEPSPNA